MPITILSQKSGGFTGTAPAQLTSWNQVLADKEVERCCTCATKTVHRGSLVESRFSGEGRRQGIFGQQLLLDPTRWTVQDEHECYRTAVHEISVTAEIVTNLCEQGRLTEAVEALGILLRTDGHVSSSLFYAMLKECLAKKDLAQGRRVHALTVQQGYESDTFLCSHFVRMYSAHARLEEAMDTFIAVAEPDAYTWSAIISANVKHGQDHQAIQLYERMRRSSVKPDGHVFLAALQACGKAGDLESGQQVHADVLASGVQLDLFVSGGLVDMYAKCGSLEDAQAVFDRIPQKDVVTWSAMMSGYSQHGRGHEALRLYEAMQDDGIVAPNAVTFVSLLQACASVGTPALEKGKELHAQIRGRGLEANVFIANSVVNMYAKCGSLEDAQAVFDGLCEKNVVTWSAMIAGYSQQGMGVEALRIYRDMQEEGIVAPNDVTFVCLLKACANVGILALEKGKQLHEQIREQGLQADVVVATSLVNMYAKCGSLVDAQAVFDGLPRKDVVTWNAMIAGYSQQGMGLEPLGLYKSMCEEGTVAPNCVTLMSLLQACANVAALHLGRQLHAQIKEQGLQADVLVAASLINMYGKCGSMVEAQQVFEALPERDDVAWNALVAGYTRQGDSVVVLDLFHRMREDGIQPASITFLSLLTVCSHTGLVNEGREYLEAMSRQYGIQPTVEHYTCMVDLLGRAGHLEEALTLVRTMPVLPDAAVWRTLMGACRKWGNVEVGRLAFDEAVKVEMEDAAAYVLMSNMYADAQMWESAEQIQAQRLGIGAWKQPGESWWTDMDGVVHSFLAGEEE